MKTNPDDQFDEEEAKRRFEAALRGTRLAKPQAMKDIVGKGKDAAAGAKSRVKKSVRSRPKSP